MPNLSKITSDHDVIRNWAEERGAKPSHVKRTGSRDDIGVLRLDFPGYGGEGTLEPITWEQFFEKFDERKLALVYEDETASGQKSNFNKLISAETAAASTRKSAGHASKRGSSAVAKKRGTSARNASKAAKRPAAKKAAPKKSAAKKTRPAARKKASSTGGRRTAAKRASRKTASKKSSAKKSSAAKRRR
ncbi:MAG: hypothetical protein JO033_16615 [Acidobacteriaceae bacterium]|nr:hypothetical protein [Acidobacteriaceae bacterium]MBV9497992.1 hypothetical protein [Acidobacteriaceae bacterium]